MTLNVAALKSVLHQLSDAVVGASHLHEHIDALDQAEVAPAPVPEPPPEGFEEVPGQPGTYRRIGA